MNCLRIANIFFNINFIYIEIVIQKCRAQRGELYFPRRGDINQCIFANDEICSAEYMHAQGSKLISQRTMNCLRVASIYFNINSICIEIVIQKWWRAQQRDLCFPPARGCNPLHVHQRWKMFCRIHARAMFETNISTNNELFTNCEYIFFNINSIRIEIIIQKCRAQQGESRFPQRGDVKRAGYLARKRCNIAARRNRSLSRKEEGCISKWLHSHGIAHMTAAKSLGAPPLCRRI